MSMDGKPKGKITNYLSLVKFSHTIFAMPFALIGYFLAVKHEGYGFTWTSLLLVILCMVFARTAAMAFNRYVDREIDLNNPRTALREIPAGIIRPRSAIQLVILSSLLFMACTWFINPLVFKLSPLAIIIVLGYSFTKKFTSLSHFVLGLGLSLAPIGAYLAVTAHFDLIPLLYSVVVLLWVGGFDIIYALQDEDFDKNEQLKSIPVWLGRKYAMFFSTIVHLIAAVLVIIAGLLAGFGWIYWLGSAVFISLLFYQHLIVKPNDISRLNVAFFTTNGLASLIFAAFVIAQIYLG
jgi:4-hydroxybenzoate polyprenyltransferase